MIWKVEFDNRARKELRNLEAQSQARILQWLRETVATPEDPRRTGSPLKGRFKGLWRYRLGKFRIVCHIQEKRVVVICCLIA
jgi:mRNA interferase RelE/StbE